MQTRTGGIAAGAPQAWFAPRANLIGPPREAPHRIRGEEDRAEEEGPEEEGPEEERPKEEPAPPGVHPSSRQGPSRVTHDPLSGSLETPK